MNALALLGAGVDPERRVVCAGAYRGRQCDLPLRHDARADRDARGDRAQLRHLFLRRWAADRHPAHRAEMVQHGLWPALRPALPASATAPCPNPAWLEQREHREWQDYDTINMSIGQGYVLVNPLQQAVMAARIASGRAAPAAPADRRTRASRPASRCRCRPSISPSSATAMEAVVNGNGTARGAKLPVDGVLMGGKTGTAQVRRISLGERAGGVRSNESLAWRMRDHALSSPSRRPTKPRYACAAIVEHGGFGARARRRRLVRDVDDLSVRQGPGDGRARAAGGAMGRHAGRADGAPARMAASTAGAGGLAAEPGMMALAFMPKPVARAALAADLRWCSASPAFGLLVLYSAAGGRSPWALPQGIALHRLPVRWRSRMSRLRPECDQAARLPGLCDRAAACWSSSRRSASSAAAPSAGSISASSTCSRPS